MGSKRNESKSRKEAGRYAKLTCVDLFAGAGGLSLAAKLAGYSVRAAVEWDARACQTYRHNIVSRGRPRLYESDISEVEPLDFAKTHFPEGSDCDLILGGPPCQGFSRHRINGAGVNDPRNQLLLRYFDFVKAIRPRAFLIENVPGILWPRHEAYLNRLGAEARAANYRLLAPVIIDAQDFGVPQRRKRVFILGTDENFDSDFVWPPIPTHGPNSPMRTSYSPAEPAFSIPVRSSDENDLHMNHSPDLVRRLKQVAPNGGSRRDSGWTLPCHRNHDGHSDVYGRIDPSKPAPTMTASCINPSKGRFVHPTEPHGITLRQAARLQTFPDDFVFKGGLMSGGEQIGNAVPVALGVHLLKHLSKALKRAREEK